MKKNGRLNSEVMDIGVAIAILLLVFMISTGLTVMQKTARVINYTGLVRGSTQRLVKLELMEEEHPELVERLDNWILELHTGEGDSNLSVIKDEAYQQCLAELSDYWDILKQDIVQVRAHGEKQTLLEHSETYFELADRLVSSAENYSNRQSQKLKTLEYVLLFLTLFLTAKLAYKTWQSVRMEKKIRDLNLLAHADTATQLPNRTAIDERMKLHQLPQSGLHHGAVMFDLNNLKNTNDKYGHAAGDALIANFAYILKQCAENRCFVGRYGGDEFVALFEETSEEAIKQFIDAVFDSIEAFNRKKTMVQIDSAYGYCYAATPTSMECLVQKADKNMYEQKASMKKGRTA